MDQNDRRSAALPKRKPTPKLPPKIKLANLYLLDWYPLAKKQPFSVLKSTHKIRIIRKNNSKNIKQKFTRSLPLSGFFGGVNYPRKFWWFLLDEFSAYLSLPTTVWVRFLELFQPSFPSKSKKMGEARLDDPWGT